MKLKSQNKTVMFIKDLSKQMETKKFFCENLLFNLRTPCPFFLNKKYGPLSRSALGGGLSKTFFCKNKIMVPLFPPHLSEGGGWGCMKLLQKKLFGVQFSLKQIGARQCWILKPTLTWFKLV